jgi:gamma-glutamylcyclotransferase (GGCT)/AIG2-like uncharacterized protein YtfP
LNQRRQILFVYGTLMSSAKGALGMEERHRLAREGKNLGPAIFSGARLYDLGSYPGLRDGHGRGDIVYGEALELGDAEETFLWLDSYEGLHPAAGSEYVRTERQISLARGESVTAWVYILKHDRADDRRISSGRWSAR